MVARLRFIRQARRLGLKTILKPQLWAPRRFTGDIVFDKPADFARWWAGYRRWMLHHARVAALGRADLLVIGTELGGVTRHHEAWRALIRDVRRIYPGPLTYAANWWGDFETMPFWGDLDLLGLNMYYPLAAKGETPRADSPRLRELRAKLTPPDEPMCKRLVMSPSFHRALVTLSIWRSSWRGPIR